MVVRRKINCDHCGKIVSSIMGDSDSVKSYLNNKLKDHYKNCKIKVREDRLNKLLK
ncbi:MAG: hypothetical protein SLAVMIC_00608 [uncultured marine phage]|uniref:Uncharacterized protein n=1 Tax=uncultured marine phage TaxID=707152 RepID=A0A8D9CDC3_9VIRU|nr:MAG: hypothetical protein SLAVMIC_00608 [uncultured marine phage]